MFSIIRNILNLLISHFIIYTKIIQWLNIENEGYIGKIIFNYLKIFINKEPFFDSDIINMALFKLTNKGFVIDKIPINSGTISLVYIGYLNNIKYAIKIKRNNIEIRVKNVFATLKFFSKFVDMLGYPLSDFILAIE